MQHCMQYLFDIAAVQVFVFLKGLPITHTMAILHYWWNPLLIFPAVWFTIISNYNWFFLSWASYSKPLICHLGGWKGRKYDGSKISCLKSKLWMWVTTNLKTWFKNAFPCIKHVVNIMGCTICKLVFKKNQDGYKFLYWWSYLPGLNFLPGIRPHRIENSCFLQFLELSL